MEEDNDYLIKLIEESFGKIDKERKKSVEEYNRKWNNQTDEEKDKFNNEFYNILIKSWEKVKKRK